MSWAPSGTNNTPLGAARRRPDDSARDPARQQRGTAAEAAHADGFDTQSAIERARAIARSVLGTGSTASVVGSQPIAARGAEVGTAAAGAGERKRRRKNRWGTKEASAGMSAALTGKMSKEQVENYAAVLRIDEITRKLKSGDVVPDAGQRSPSPAPVYDGEGRRTNTREHRYRRRLEEERTRLVEEQVKRDANYRPPADYRKRSRYSERVFIPVDENPGLNFIGLLIGPRGNTLKKIEGDSGTKISIRGKGSIKEGKRRDDASIPGADEELHCLVVADSEDKVKKGVRIVREIIREACVTPEGRNDLKRNQLRELAALNGTLRDDEGQACTNCGALGHRRWECPEQCNVTASLVCHVCGGRGHIARDCAQRHDPDALKQARERDQQLNSEYLSLMAELGESVDAPHDPRAAGAQDQPAKRRGEPDDGRRAEGAAHRAQAPWLRKAGADAAPANAPDGQGHRTPPRSPAPYPPAVPSTPPWLRRRAQAHSSQAQAGWGQGSAPPWSARRRQGGHQGYGGRQHENGRHRRHGRYQSPDRTPYGAPPPPPGDEPPPPPPPPESPPLPPPRAD